MAYSRLFAQKPVRCLGVLCSVTCLLTAAVFAAPAITLSTTSGPPTTNITVSGTGFTASSLIDIYFDTNDVTLAVTDATGSFSGITMQAPATAQPGSHWITAVVRISGLAAQKSFLVRTNWVERGFTPKNRRGNPYENTLSPSTVGSIDMDWSFKTGNWVYSSPAVVNGVVFVGSHDFNVYALKASTGTKLWSFATGNYVYSSPAVANGKVYVGSDDGNLYALNSSTGAKLWSFKTGGFVESSPAVVNGLVYFGSDDNSVYALNASTGAKVWSFLTGGRVISSPAVANGIVYVGSNDGKVYALDASTGANLWTNTFDSALVESSPAVANGLVYVGSENGLVYCLKANTGQMVRAFPAGGPAFSSPSVVNGVLYVGLSGGSIYAFNARLAGLGNVLWGTNFGDYDGASDVRSSPAVANGVVYIADSTGVVWALSASTGAILWNYQTGSSVESSPAVADGTLYVGSLDGRLYAFDLAGGLAAKRSADILRPDPEALVPNFTLIP